MLNSVDVIIKFISIVRVYREGQKIKGCPGLQIYSKQQMSSFELSSCFTSHQQELRIQVPCYVFRQQFAVKRVKCSSFLFHSLRQSLTTKIIQTRPQVLSVNGSIICQLCCTIDVISSIWQNSFKFGRQQLVMMNYGWDFSQSETAKYFE